MSIQIKELSSKVTTLQTSSAEVNKKIQESTAELNNLKGILSGSGIDITTATTIQNSINFYKNKISELENKKAALEADKESYAIQISNLQQQIKDLNVTITNNKKLSDAEIKNLNTQIVGLTTDLTNANNTINSLNTTISNLNSQINAFRSDIAEMEDKLLEIKLALKIDPDATQAEILEAIKTLQDSLDKAYKDIETIGTALGSTKPTDIVAVKAQADNVMNTLEQYKLKIEHYKSLVSSFQLDPNEELSTTLGSLIDKYNDSVAKINAYSDFIRELIEQLDVDANASFSDILSKIQDLQDELQQHKDAVSEINSTLNIDSASSLQDTKDVVTQRQRELEILNNAFTEVKNELSLYLAINNTLPTEREQAEQAVSDFITMYEETNAEANRLLTFLQDCQAILSLDSSSTTVDILNRIRELQRQLTLANQQITNYSDNVNQMVDTLQLNNSSLPADKAAVVNYKTSELKSDLDSTKGTLNTLQSELADITGTVGSSEAVQNMVNALNANITDSLDKINELNNINTSLRNAVAAALNMGSGATQDELVDKINGINQDLNNLQQSNSELTNSNNNLQGQNQIYDQDNTYLKDLTDDQLKKLYELLQKVFDTTSDQTISNNILSRLTEIENKLAGDITQQTTTLTNTINNIETSIKESISNSQIDINNSITDVDNRLGDLEQSLTSINNNIDTQFETVGNDQSEMSDRLDSIEEQIADLKSLITSISSSQEETNNTLADLQLQSNTTKDNTNMIYEKLVPYNLGSTLQENNAILSELVTRDVTITDTPTYNPSPEPTPSPHAVSTTKPAPSVPIQTPTPMQEAVQEAENNSFMAWINANRLLLIISGITVLALIITCVYFLYKKNKEEE